ncbi:MAG: hypothetical protein ACFE95_02655 [Candidatus Hodarchaeota archaeon]
MKLAIINNFKRLDSNKDKVRFIVGFLRIVQWRQQSYLSLVTPILVAGLYGKEKIIYFIQHYWYIVPIWLLWIVFDILILFPGEQLFTSSSNKLFMDIHKGKNHENRNNKM